MALKFENYSMEVEEALNAAVVAFLYEASGELEAKVKRDTPVDTGQLKNSWTHKVYEYKGQAVVGSNLENAIWNEFGTGQYALNGNGRKTSWKYKDTKGKWHKTTGKAPRRTFHIAYESLKPKLQTALAQKLKGLK